MNRGSWKATVCRVTKSHMQLSTYTEQYSRAMLLKHPFTKGMGFCQWLLFGFFFFPLEVSDIQESIEILSAPFAEFIQNCIPMQLHRRSKIQKIYCNPEGFLCSFSIYNCLRNSISLSSITIVSSCLWLYFIQLKSYRVHRLSIHGWIVYLSVQFSSITQSCPTLCSLMNLSMPGLPVHHQLPEFTQIHVHQVSDAIQPSHPLSSPSPPALSPSQHQSLFQWVNSSHEVAKVLEFQL